MTLTTTLRKMFHTAQRSAAKMFGVNEYVWSAISRMGIGGGMVLAASGVMVTAEVALTISAYKRGVELLSTHVAKTSFQCMAKSQIDCSHPSSPLIRWWARHHQMSAFEFRRTLMVHALTSGNGYGYIVREGGAAVELLLLDPSQVDPELVQGRLQYRVTGRNTPVSASDMIHIKGMGFNGYKGLDPIRYYAREVLGLAIATQTYAAKYYENGGTPAAYLKSEVPLTDDQFNRLKGEAGPLKRSVENPHELPILEQTDIKSVGLTAEQTQLLTARKDIILDIANLLGIPPHKLGLAISTSYGSLEEENDAFRDDALDPWLVQFEMEYRKLLTEDEQAMETHEICATRHDVTRMKSADKATYISTLTGSVAVMNVNDGRAILGLPPVDGGDVLLTPLNMAAAGAEPGKKPKAESGKPEVETDPVTETGVPADASIQDAALNGAQVTGLLAVLAQINTGLLSKDAAVSVIRAAFPGIPEALVAKIVNGTSTDPPAAEPQIQNSKSEIRNVESHQLRALEDVYTRMTRRLVTASGKVKRVDQLAEFRNGLDAHTAVIRSAFEPIVPLCGGEDAGPYAEMLVAEFRSRLITAAESEDISAAVASLGATFILNSREFATAALKKINSVI